MFVKDFFKIPFVFIGMPNYFQQPQDLQNKTIKTINATTIAKSKIKKSRSSPSTKTINIIKIINAITAPVIFMLQKYHFILTQNKAFVKQNKERYTNNIFCEIDIFLFNYFKKL
jgi:hypothetical protein